MMASIAVRSLIRRGCCPTLLLLRPAGMRTVALLPARHVGCATFASTSTATKSSLKFLEKEQPRLRLGSLAPNFTAETTHGKIDFHQFAAHPSH